MAIYSKLRELRFKREERDGVDLTYEVLQRETGLAPATLARLYTREPLKRVDAETLDRLCEFFGVGLSDLLEYRPNGDGSTSTDAPVSIMQGEPGFYDPDTPDKRAEVDAMIQASRQSALDHATIPGEGYFDGVRARMAARRAAGANPAA